MTNPKKDFNVWCKWDPLKKVIIGSCVHPEYFDHVANIEIREKLQQIVIETQEDLDNISDVCQKLGAEVLRVNPNNRYFPKYLDPGKKTKKITPLLLPRDQLVVIGNDLISSDRNVMLDNLYPEITKELMKKNTPWHSLNVKHRIEYFQPPSWTLVGKDLFMDVRQDHTNPLGWHDDTTSEIIEKWAAKWFPQIDIHWCDIGGHNDGCFHTLKPGVIMSLNDIMTYEKTFPGWEVLYLPDQSFSKVSGFMSMKSKTDGRYWLPGEENNQPLLDYINTWLDDWVGYVEETVFDVNCLVINESTVLVNNYNKTVFDFLKKHSMEPIICPLRHRYFWDGGIHCVSLDLYRQGECQSYIDYK